MKTHFIFKKLIFLLLISVSFFAKTVDAEISTGNFYFMDYAGDIVTAGGDTINFTATLNGCGSGYTTSRTLSTLQWFFHTCYPTTSIDVSATCISSTTSPNCEGLQTVKAHFDLQDVVGDNYYVYICGHDDPNNPNKQYYFVGSTEGTEFGCPAVSKNKIIR